MSCSAKPTTAVSTALVVIRPATENPARLPTTIIAISVAIAVTTSTTIRGSRAPIRGSAIANTATCTTPISASSSNARLTTAGVRGSPPSAITAATTSVDSTYSASRNVGIRNRRRDAGTSRVAAVTPAQAATTHSVRPCSS